MLKLNINDKVKRSRGAKRIYIVVGFDNPLPHTGGGEYVIAKLASGKSKKLTRLDPNCLYKVNGVDA